ncbi:cbb3-type cytochrome oxidase subunit 3 [Rhodovarius lipocyclicus]|uniref:cbb3-type cytochrome oxidase subunit 3 n=1 Tax=Rhodovarius lipocyclicus TaxID=268410 RepID=UPI001358E363|nr:cbb3-type cytochrome c oxidase subunit 3 [Rhodovarius lipocyclicus]
MIDELARHHGVFATLWVVWFFVLFSGILVWVLLPSRKRELESHAQIPLRKDG